MNGSKYKNCQGEKELKKENKIDRGGKGEDREKGKADKKIGERLKFVKE
jgi:hypothetical protein